MQVTSNSVRLVSSTSRDLKNEWFAPAGYSVNVATANATQVYLLNSLRTYNNLQRAIDCWWLIFGQMLNSFIYYGCWVFLPQKWNRKLTMITTYAVGCDTLVVIGYRSQCTTTQFLIYVVAKFYFLAHKYHFLCWY